MSRTYRWILKTARTVHVYLTLLGLTLILFFAVTGFMLNHMSWFLPDDAKLEKLKRTDRRALPLDRMPGGKLPEPDPNDPAEATAEGKLLLVEALRKEFDIRGEMTTVTYTREEVDDPAADPNVPEDDRPKIERRLIKVEFLRAGDKIEASIDRATGMTEVVSNYQGWPIVMTDLHRGNRGNLDNETKRTGRVWSFVIDATCFLLLIIAATGLVMWWSLKSRGKWGVVAFLLGTGAAFAVYYWFVP